MQIEYLAANPELLEDLDCFIKKLGSQAKSSALIYDTYGHDVGTYIFFALYN